MWIGEPFYLGPRYPDRFHDLELVGMTRRLGLQFSLGGLAYSGAFRGGGSCGFVRFGAKAFKVLSEHLHFADDLVCSGLCLQVHGAYNELKGARKSVDEYEP